jgi:hypothetical protein
VLLRPIKEAGTLLPRLVGVDGIIKSPLLTGSRARVVWPLLRVAKEKRHGCPTKANLP